MFPLILLLISSALSNRFLSSKGSSILIKNGLLIDDVWKMRADLLIEDGKISRIAPEISPSDLKKPCEIFDATGLYVLPGLIDSHTHYHLVSRGTVTADSFAEGSKLAAFGGVTTVVDFADHDKKKGLSRSAGEREDAMREKMAIDFTLHQGVYGIVGDIPQELEKLKSNGVRTIKIFTTYRNVGYLIEKEDELRFLFKECKRLGILITVHCEDDSEVTKINENWGGTFRPEDHAELRPPSVEAKGIAYVGGIALSLDMPLYIVHLSSKAGLDEVRKLRAKGAKLFVETTPTYLFLEKSKLKGEEGSLFVMTPPLREKEDNAALLEALANGEVQVVATDHCSFTKEQKLSSNDCRYIYPGIPGTEEMFTLVNTFSRNSDKLSIQQLVSLMSSGPAKLFGLYPDKGSLKVGTDADVVLYDPNRVWTLSKESTHSASCYTPYDGRKVFGKVVRTYLRGQLIVDEDKYYGIEGSGRHVRQKGSSAYE